MNNLVHRFIEYVKFDTTSCENSKTFPSTLIQKDFAQKLVSDLKSIGLFNAFVDDHGYVYASLPSNSQKKLPKIGFIAHMDTSPALTGKNVNPQLVPNYQGEDLILDKDNLILLSPKEFPVLSQYIGHTLITTDGKTLLGADDKAGIVEIIEAIHYLIQNPEIEHGAIRIAFTPDEEVGDGADFFDVTGFDADFAYTVDGGPLGELQYENFNAAATVVTVHGKSVHPGTAKDQMINANSVGIEYHTMLPASEVPEKTEGYEGFYMLNDFIGTVEETQLIYILRDFDLKSLQNRKSKMLEIATILNEKYGRTVISVATKDQYLNMREKIEPAMHVVDTAKKAMELIGITPIIEPIRGGTDGARLSFMGLPTPNIFTGGHNFHGKYEFISVQSMEKAVQVLLKIIELNTIL